MATQAYKGYLVTQNPIIDLWFISCDGFHIGSAQSLDAAKAAINLLVTPIEPGPLTVENPDLVGDAQYEAHERAAGMAERIV